MFTSPATRILAHITLIHDVNVEAIARLVAGLICLKMPIFGEGAMT